MKKTLSIVAAAIGLVVLLVVAVVGYLVASQPDVIHVERSANMAATPADVLPYAEDFTKFVTWSPWSDLDPDQEVSFSDPPSGVGAWYAWKGNDQVGEGRMTVTAVDATVVAHDLEFLAPWTSQADVSLVATPVGQGQVAVTWTYDQQADMTSKVMGIFMDMDAMLGPDYEKGLARLQPLVEADAAARVEAERLAAEAAAAEAEAALEAEEEDE